jgi:hypothetical protein
LDAARGGGHRPPPSAPVNPATAAANQEASAFVLAVGYVGPDLPLATLVDVHRQTITAACK